MSTPSPSTPSFPESPYRVPAPVVDASPARADEPSDPALAWMALAFVIASLVRGAHPLFGHEIFGAEPTLALLAALVVGYQLARHVHRGLTRRGSPRWREEPVENDPRGRWERC